MGKGQSQDAVYTSDPQAVQFAGQLRGQSMNQAMIDANRARAMAQGRQLGQEFFGQGTLPRIREGRSQEMADILGNRRALSDVAGQRSAGSADYLSRLQGGLGGYSAPQYGAQRQRSYEGFQNQMQTGQRDVSRNLAQNRIQGDAAGAALARFNQMGNAEAAKAERDIFLADIDEQQRRLQNYGQTLTGMEGTEWGRQNEALNALQQLTQGIETGEEGRAQFNIGQFQKERLGQLQSILGFAGLGSNDLASTAQMWNAQQQMGSALGGGGGGKGK